MRAAHVFGVCVCLFVCVRACVCICARVCSCMYVFWCIPAINLYVTQPMHFLVIVQSMYANQHRRIIFVPICVQVIALHEMKYAVAI
jgi:hypothetical protein